MICSWYPREALGDFTRIPSSSQPNTLSHRKLSSPFCCLEPWGPTFHEPLLSQRPLSQVPTKRAVRTNVFSPPYFIGTVKRAQPQREQKALTLSHPLRVAEPGMMCSLRTLSGSLMRTGEEEKITTTRGTASVPLTVATMAYEK